jgi:pimeloyl-ACP methyl ester carboxylesterase
MSAATLFFRESGEGEAVVCIHASASSSGQWRPLMERIGKRCRLIAPDLMGYGRSPAWQGDWDLWLNDEVDSLAPVLGAAGQTFSLIGHSYGVAVALKAALRYREQLRCLIVYEPVLVVLLVALAPDHPATAEITALRDNTIRAVEQDDLATAAEQFVDYWLGAGTWATLPEARRMPLMQGMRKVAAEWRASSNEPRPLADFASLEAPTLYLTGTLSPAPTRKIAALLAPVLPGVELVELDGMGHMGPITHPERVNAAIERHLTQTLRA